MTDIPTIAIIGCGAISEYYYLPAIKRYHDIVEQLTLVDTDEHRLRTIATVFGTEKAITDYHSVLGEVDGVIVATPHSTHHRIAMDFLREGAHVLCEKPLATSASDAREMVLQAERSGVTLSVNNIYRLYPSFQRVKKLLSDQSFGKIHSITYLDGENFDWPTASGFYFDRKAAKGVLLDKGAHALDTICWWIGHKPTLVSCQTDSFGGPEAAALVKFQHECLEGEVRLSWLAKLQNHYRIECERGSISGGTTDWGRITVTSGGRRPMVMEVDLRNNPQSIMREKTVDNFLNVIRGKSEPLVPAKEVVDSIELIEQSYTIATRFDMPWCNNVERI